MSAADTAITGQLFDDSFKEVINPFEVFEIWMEEAIASEINDPTAMSVATVDSAGLPDVRMILLNGRDDRGFVFYTNFQSTKGRELLDNPKAALLFHWKSLRRQVRIRGDVEQVSDAEADAYFATRPRGSQVGAHASAQSRPLENRTELVARIETLEKEFGDNTVPRPAHWSGFRVKPVEIEFWQNGEFRLHDRVLFQRNEASSGWTRSRLNP